MGTGRLTTGDVPLVVKPVGFDRNELGGTKKTFKRSPHLFSNAFRQGHSSSQQHQIEGFFKSMELSPAAPTSVQKEP